MDGVHDLGGKQGFGPVRYRPDAAVFHEDWEKRINALYGVAVRAGIFNMDEYRHAIERMDPRHYMNAGYYERTLTSLATLCVEKGVVSLQDLEQRAGGAFPLANPLGPGRSNAADRTDFTLGQRVQVRNGHVGGHVRLPGYIRGKTGVVVHISPAYPFPDAHAHGVYAEDEPTFDVRFKSTDLWPDAADAAFVHVGVFQSYLVAAL
ncbi:MAG: nitrile hydratase subunit beta [Betaproteobacteria bacterium]|nr:nitrile hydratase subunit beta [Betaproteobacteria bacterium]NBY04727.1 nitrile hydratase subunit beta [Betaproteobacteria bacterium]